MFSIIDQLEAEKADLERHIKKLDRQLTACLGESEKDDKEVEHLHCVIEKLEQAQRWIPVKERLPPPQADAEYQVCSAHHRIWWKERWADGMWWTEPGPRSLQITHWRAFIVLPGGALRPHPPDRRGEE